MRIFGARFFSAAQTGTKPYSILMFGSDEYSKATLASLLSNPNYSKVAKRLAIVAPGSAGTGSASESFHQLIKERQIEKLTFRVKFDAVERFIKTQEENYEFPFDLGIIASFRERLPDRILNLFPKGVIVAHPSLLPKYRGGSPIEHCIMNAEKKTGVTILEATKEKMGSGKIMLQKQIDIAPNDAYIHVAQKCGALAGEALAEVLDNLDQFKENAKPQDATGTEPKAPLIGKPEAILLWDQLTTAQAVRKQMALYQSAMPAFTKLKVKNTWHYVYFDHLEEEKDRSTDYYRKVLAPVDAVATPGAIHWSARGMRDRISIRCLDGWVSANSVRVEGLRGNKVKTFIERQLRSEHFSEDTKFKHKFAGSKDIIRLEEKIEI